jgi:hypothetical protein
MATAPPIGMSAGAAAGIGAIGNAINAYQDRKGQQAMLAQQTQQLKDQIAFQRKAMEQQAILRQEEVARQQMLAQAAGGAFADSRGLFQNVEGDIGTKANNISDVFRAVLARQAPQSTAPMGTGPTSGYEAAMRAERGAEVGQDANRLAAVQAFGQVMNDKGYAMSENDQLAALLRNFGAGSQQASQAEIQARAGQLYQPQIVRPAPSVVGDLFVGLANAGAQYANRPPAAPSPYALSLPSGGETGFKATGGLGIRTDRPAGLGIR